MVSAEGSSVRKRKEAIASPWLTTAYDILNVIRVDDKTGAVTVGGKPLTEQQAAQLKSEAQLFRDKFTMMPLLLDTLRKQAVDIGINKSENFDHTLTAKAVCLTVDSLNGLIAAFASLNLNNKK